MWPVSRYWGGSIYHYNYLSKHGLRPCSLHIVLPSGQRRPSITIWVIAAGWHCLGIVLILFGVALMLATVMHLNAYIYCISYTYTLLKYCVVMSYPIGQWLLSQVSFLCNSLLRDRERAFSSPECWQQKYTNIQCAVHSSSNTSWNPTPHVAKYAMGRVCTSL